MARKLYRLLLIWFTFNCAFRVAQGAPLEFSSDYDDYSDFDPFDTCSLCERIVKDIFDSFVQGKPDEEIVNSIGETCESLFQNVESCKGIASIAAPTLRFILTSGKVDSGNICGILLQSRNCSFADKNKIEWAIPLSNQPKPPVKQLTLPQNDLPTLKILHIADPHWDPEYLEGSNAVCGRRLCCRASSGSLADLVDAAGYWGDYRDCDMPWRTIETAVAHMAKHHSDAAFIVWTGDLVPHDDWSTSREENFMVQEKLLNLTRQYFPKTPIYPTLGNHEAHPVNAFSPPEITEELSTTWLYKDADFLWTRLGLPAEVSSTIRHGGYYTALARPGLRIVSLNTNYCYTLNWWTLYKSDDPASGLQWLSKILEKAEKSGEKVHLIAHIPPGGSDCIFTFSREFSKIINRFESTVMAQFYGHTHTEEFKVFYDAVNKTRPTNVAFIAGSLSSYTKLNPSYRVYTVDGARTPSTWAILDYSTWIMNLTEANIHGQNKTPKWFELYQARNEYGLSDLTPRSVDSLFQRLLVDKKLFNKYFRNYHKAVDSVVAEGCDEDCRKERLCEFVTTNVADKSHCTLIK